MSKMICNICGSDRIVEDGYYGGTTFAECEICNANGDIDFLAHHETLFDRITVSPEVLAEKLVYEICSDKGETYWASTIVFGSWLTKVEAITATAAKLKEVMECP